VVNWQLFPPATVSAAIPGLCQKVIKASYYTAPGVQARLRVVNPTPPRFLRLKSVCCQHGYCSAIQRSARTQADLRQMAVRVAEMGVLGEIDKSAAIERHTV